MSPAQSAQERLQTTHEENPFSEFFAEWLKAELERQNVSVQALGQACGVSASHIYKVLHAQYTTIRSMSRISKGLGYDLQLTFHPITTR